MSRRITATLFAMALCVVLLPASSFAQSELATWRSQMGPAGDAHLAGDFAEAERLYSSALELAERFDTSGQYLEASLSGLAGLYFAQGRYEDAVLRFRQAISIAEALYDPDDPKRTSLDLYRELLIESEGLVRQEQFPSRGMLPPGVAKQLPPQPEPPTSRTAVPVPSTFAQTALSNPETAQSIVRQEAQGGVQPLALQPLASLDAPLPDRQPPPRIPLTPIAQTPVPTPEPLDPEAIIRPTPGPAKILVPEPVARPVVSQSRSAQSNRSSTIAELVPSMSERSAPLGSSPPPLRGSHSVVPPVSEGEPNREPIRSSVPENRTKVSASPKPELPMQPMPPETVLPPQNSKLMSKFAAKTVQRADAVREPQRIEVAEIPTQPAVTPSEPLGETEKLSAQINQISNLAQESKTVVTSISDSVSAPAREKVENTETVGALPDSAPATRGVEGTSVDPIERVSNVESLQSAKPLASASSVKEIASAPETQQPETGFFEWLHDLIPEQFKGGAPEPEVSVITEATSALVEEAAIPGPPEPIVTAETLPEAVIRTEPEHGSNSELNAKEQDVSTLSTIVDEPAVDLAPTSKRIVAPSEVVEQAEIGADIQNSLEPSMAEEQPGIAPPEPVIGAVRVIEPFGVSEQAVPVVSQEPVIAEEPTSISPPEPIVFANTEATAVIEPSEPSVAVKKIDPVVEPPAAPTLAGDQPFVSPSEPQRTAEAPAAGPKLKQEAQPLPPKVPVQDSQPTERAKVRPPKLAASENGIIDQTPVQPPVPLLETADVAIQSGAERRTKPELTPETVKTEIPTEEPNSDSIQQAVKPVVAKSKVEPPSLAMADATQSRSSEPTYPEISVSEGPPSSSDTTGTTIEKPSVALELKPRTDLEEILTSNDPVPERGAAGAEPKPLGAHAQLEKAMTQAEIARAATQQRPDIEVKPPPIRKATGGLVETEIAYKQDLNERLKQVSKNHPDAATGYYKLGRLYHRQGRYELAAAMYEKALGIREAALAPDDPQLIETAERYAKLLRHSGLSERATALMKRIRNLKKTEE